MTQLQLKVNKTTTKKYRLRPKYGDVRVYEDNLIIYLDTAAWTYISGTMAGQEVDDDELEIELLSREITPEDIITFK